MAVQEDEVRELVDFAPEGFLVTSFYLDVDPSEFPGPEHIENSLRSLMSQANELRSEVAKDLSHDASESLREDLARIEHFVKEEFQREDASGLAIFSCSRQGLWETFPMPQHVDSRVLFQERPYVSPIATYLSHSKPIAILLTDKQHARILTMKGNAIREWSDFEDSPPQRSQDGGSQTRFQRRSDEWAKHHVDHATDLVLKLLQHYPFDWLIVSAEVQSESDLQQTLHPYLKDRVIGNIHVRMDAPLGEIAEASIAMREEAEANLIDRRLAEVQEYSGAGGRGAMGLKDTLEALNQQRVHIMLVQDRFAKPGAECRNCGMLFASQPEKCPGCSEAVRATDNVVEVAIQRAIELGSTVEVATQDFELDPVQSIAAILYY